MLSGIFRIFKELFGFSKQSEPGKKDSKKEKQTNVYNPAYHNFHKKKSTHSQKRKSDYNAGSAKRLSGSIYVLSIFVSSTPWDKKSRESLMAKLYEAEDWIKKEAARYNSRVDFRNGAYGYDRDSIKLNVAPGHGTGNEDARVAHKALKAIGYSDISQFYDWFRKNEKCDNCMIIVFVKGNGRSYAIPYAPEYSGEFFTESCVFFECYENGTPEVSSGIAHEILHCFGAEDLYETFQKPKEVEELARKLYPDDVMHRVDYNINNLNIGEFTAWCVGLTDATKEEFKELLKEKC